MTDFTLYELIGEDHTIYAKLTDAKHVLISVKNENMQEVYGHNSHLYAWESLVSFARQVLACDERLQKDLEILE